MVRRLEDRRLYAEADARIETALGLDPESWEVNKEAARVYLRQGRLADAARHLEKAVTLMNSDVHAWARLVTVYRALGDHAAKRIAAETAVGHAEQALAQDPSNGAAMSFGALGHAALGHRDVVNEWIERGLLVDPDNPTMLYNFACMLAGHLADQDGALRYLERSFAAAGAFHINMAQADPDLDSIREHPRFQAMLNAARKKLGIDAAPRVSPEKKTSG